MKKEYLNIVDEHDNIISREDREIIHAKGLLHREIHVHFVTRTHEIIFQKRAKSKDTFPGLLDATVGGHVEIGDSYIESAVKETLEETGVQISMADLIPLDKLHNRQEDRLTGKINQAWQQEYIYIYKGKLEDLKVEAGKGLGFEKWSLNSLVKLNEEQKAKFIPYIYKLASTSLVDFVKNKI